MMSTTNRYNTGNHIHVLQGYTETSQNDQFLDLIQEISQALSTPSRLDHNQGSEKMEYQPLRSNMEQVVPSSGDSATESSGALDLHAMSPYTFDASSSTMQQDTNLVYTMTSTSPSPATNQISESSSHLSSLSIPTDLSSTELHQLAAKDAHTEFEAIAVSPSDFWEPWIAPSPLGPDIQAPTSESSLVALLTANCDETEMTSPDSSTTSEGTKAKPNPIGKGKKRPREGIKRKRVRRRKSNNTLEAVPRKISAHYNQKWENLSPDHEWDITVGYYSSQANIEKVQHPDGCLIFHRKTFPRDKLPLNIKMMKLPEIDTLDKAIQNDKKEKILTRSLDSLHGGLRLQHTPEGIEATRFSAGHIYWTNTERSTNEETEKLELKKPTLVFNFEQFRQKLSDIAKKKIRKESYTKPPSPLIWFTFTRKWKRDICDCTALQIWATVKPLSLTESVEYLCTDEMQSESEDMECDVLASDLKAEDADQFSSY